MFLHALLTSLPLLAGFTVQDLLATWLCWLASTLGGGGVIWNTTVLGTSSEPYTKI